ncbi:Adenylate cyclase 2 [Diplonema papillatum]|nr:Adenylate cyclase 2 [Diplonema papillatum]
MFMDIADFTQLTARLSEQNQGEGAEKISIVLNTFFDAVLKIIRAYGGDVVQFSGDAILTTFTGPSASKACIQCAITVAKEAPRIPLPAGKRALTANVRIGVGRGNIYRVLFGAKKRSRWSNVVCGEACLNAVEACEGIEPGELCIHDSFEDELPIVGLHVHEPGILKEPFPSFRMGAIVGADSPMYTLERRNTLPSANAFAAEAFYLSNSTASPTHSPAASAPTAPQGCNAELLKFVFKGIANRSRAEVRNVVVMFISFRGYDTPESLLILGQLLEKGISKHGGVCNKLMCDDKGTVALVCFGLPLYTYPDNVDRACACAIDMMSLFEDKVVVGISKDKVYCGEVGNGFRAEYTVLGDAVNVSSRLMAYGMRKCEGSLVVVDEIVMKETKVPIARRDSIAVKGKEELVMIGIIDAADASERGIACAEGEGGLQFVPPALTTVTSCRSLRSSASSGSVGSVPRSAWRRLRSTFRFLQEVNTSPSSASARTPNPAGPTRTVAGRDDVKRTMAEYLASILSSAAASASPPGSPSPPPGTGGGGSGAPANVLLVAGSTGMGKTSMLSFFAELLAKESIASVKLSPKQIMADLPNAGLAHFAKRVTMEVEDKLWLSTIVRQSTFPHEVKVTLSNRVSRTSRTELAIDAGTVESVVTHVLRAFALLSPQKTAFVLVDDLDAAEAGLLKAVFQSVASFASDPDVTVALVGTVRTETVSRRAAAKDPPADGNALATLLAEPAPLSLRRGLSYGSDGGGAAGEAEKCLRGLLARAKHSIAQLLPMTEAECALLCRDFLAAEAVDGELIDVLARYCDGCPLIITQALGVLLRDGIIAVTGDSVAEILYSDIEFDSILTGLDTVEACALGTLDRLTNSLGPLPIEIMKVACVVGRPFELGLISGVLNVELQGQRDELLAAVALLVAREVVYQCDDDRYYAFVSHALSLTQYNSMLGSEKREWHCRVAMVLEAEWEVFAKSYNVSDVAKHFESGLCADAASNWHARAATVAFEAGEFRAAEGHWQQSLHLGQTLDAHSDDGMPQQQQQQHPASPATSPADRLSIKNIEEVTSVDTQQKRASMLGLRKCAELSLDLSAVVWELVTVHAALGAVRPALERALTSLQISYDSVAVYAVQERMASATPLCLFCLPGLLIPRKTPRLGVITSDAELRAFAALFDLAILTNRLEWMHLTGGRLTRTFSANRRTLRNAPDAPHSVRKVESPASIKALLSFLDLDPASFDPGSVRHWTVTNLTLLFFYHAGTSNKQLAELQMDPFTFVQDTPGLERARSAAPLFAAALLLLQGRPDDMLRVVKKHSESAVKKGCHHAYLLCLSLFLLRACVYECSETEATQASMDVVAGSPEMTDDSTVRFLAQVAELARLPAHEAASFLRVITACAPHQWTNPLSLPGLLHLLHLVIFLHHQGDISSSAMSSVVKSTLLPTFRYHALNKSFSPAIKLAEAALCVARKQTAPLAGLHKASKATGLPHVRFCVVSALSLWADGREYAAEVDRLAAKHSFKVLRSWPPASGQTFRDAPWPP